MGNSDESNPDIQQVIEVLPEQGHKWYENKRVGEVYDYSNYDIIIRLELQL